MSEHQETTTYDSPLTDVPPLAEEFSLEEILAEYGGSREQRIMEDVEQAVRETEPSPAPEEPPAPPPRRTAVTPVSEASTVSAPKGVSKVSRYMVCAMVLSCQFERGFFSHSVGQSEAEASSAPTSHVILSEAKNLL